MQHYSTQPETPVRQSRTKSTSFAPLTPHTPLSALKPSKNASASTFRTPLSSYNSNIAFTPPPSLPRAQRTSAGQNKKSDAADSWRKPFAAVDDSPTRPASSGDLLPSAFISTQRRTSLRKPDPPKADRTTPRRTNIWTDAPSEPAFPETPVRHGRHASLSLQNMPSPLSPFSPVRQARVDRRNVSVTSIPEPSPILVQQPVAEPQLVCGSCGSTATDVTLSCAHAMCSGCFTSSLNIVGEKPFACPTCSERIQDFRFTSSPMSKSPKKVERSAPQVTREISPEPMWDTTSLHDAFAEISADQLAVLRLDDVPWDVTPRMLSEWAGVPSQQAHVLLDRDGKTLSHAFIEAHPQAAREILVTCRNKVLGHGRRARRVTLTTSSQDELLQQLFTGWTGKFLNGHASVAHLGPQQIPTLLNNGILPLPELEILAKRILQPDQRYVKDPSLPYYSLISVLNKFPYDSDSRVFWTLGTRDTLFTIAYSSMLRLSSSEPEDWKPVVMRAIAASVFHIPIFTGEQIQQVHALLEADASTSSNSISGDGYSPSTFSSQPIPTPSPPADAPADSAFIYNPMSFSPAPMQQSRAPAQPNGFMSQGQGPWAGQQQEQLWNPFNAIASELGVEPHLVQAVCDRLANFSLV